MRYISVSLLLLLGWSSWLCVAASQTNADHLCVAHLEVPDYPRLARLAQRQAVIDVTVDINGDGHVIAARTSTDSFFRIEVENNVRTWTFKHLPVNAKFPITHMVRFEFKLQGERAEGPARVSFDLPDKVLIVAHPPIPQP